MSVYTLLEIVQDVHNDLNLDITNSIGDTTESTRVAQIAKTVYFEFINRRDWPHLQKIGKLSSAASMTQKTSLLFPSNLSKIVWITYNRRKDTETRFKPEPLTYLYPDDFIQLANGLNSDAANVEEMEVGEDVRLLVRNDKAPEYWTSFDDEVIVLDSYDSAVESTVQGDNTQMLYYKIPTWTHEDDSVPDLPVEAFPGYLAEVKSVASFRINEIPDSKAEQQAVRQQRRLSNQSWRAHGGIRMPDYGRKTKGTYSRASRRRFDRD
jgi:hypothetical protein